jgi:hypothetical protein
VRSHDLNAVPCALAAELRHFRSSSLLLPTMDDVPLVSPAIDKGARKSCMDLRTLLNAFQPSSWPMRMPTLPTPTSVTRPTVHVCRPSFVQVIGTLRM